MWFLYLDESGDLGFDFVNKNPSRYFTVTILAVSSKKRNRLIFKAVSKTLKRKLNNKSSRKRIVEELKGTQTMLSVKKYFFRQLKKIKFGLYSYTLNKRRVYDKLADDKSRVYNYISRLVLDKIPFEDAPTRVHLIIDKSKSKNEVEEFDNYLIEQLEGRLDPKVPINIFHYDSKDNSGLQAVDMFCWGFFRKYERNDFQWYNIFKDKVRFDGVYLP